MSVFTNPASGSKEHAQAYVAAILGLLGSKKPLTVLSGTERALRKAIKGLSARQLARHEAPGKWSIAQVLQHLADSDLVWGWRVRLILSHDRPTITGYDQDLWADRLHYAKADARLALEDFAQLRASNLRLLRKATPADLERVGVHAERGEESIAHLIRLYAGHDLLHLNQIDRIKAVVR